MVWLLGTLLFFSAACGKQGEEQEDRFSAEESRFLYEAGEEANAIAVGADGTLYTVMSRRAENAETGEAEERYAHTVCTFDLQGNLLEEKTVAFGNGTVTELEAEGNRLYGVVPYLMGSESVPAVFELSLDTWEITRSVSFPQMRTIRDIESAGNTWYCLGRAAKPQEKEFELCVDAEDYRYRGEELYRFSFLEEGEPELLPVAFPIAMSATQSGTLLLYAYDESRGYGFFLYDPVTGEQKEVAWRNHGVNFSFSVCDGRDSYVCFRSDGQGQQVLTYFSMEESRESEIAREISTSMEKPVYAGGFVFFSNALTQKQERIGMAAKRNNPTIRFLTTQFAERPFGCGYNMEVTQLEEDAFALKVLAQDKDYDMCLLSSRDRMSHNIRENAVFYPLNEVEGVSEYLDACFPYLKETATREDGTVWMLPISVTIPGLIYQEEAWEEIGLVPLPEQTFSDFLLTAEQLHREQETRVTGSVYLLVESFLMQYSNSYASYDTEEFRSLSEQVKKIYEAGTAWKYNDSVSRDIKKDGKLEFLYLYELYRDSFLGYREAFSKAQGIGVCGIPKLKENGKNLGTCIFLAVNPSSKNLNAVLDYITAYTQYCLTQKNTLLFAEKEAYDDTPYMQAVYELYANGEIYFELSSEIYEECFYRYLEGEASLEKTVSEIERRRKAYLGE